MANFFEDFVASTGNFFVAAQVGYPTYRTWYIDYVKLIPADAVANQPGFILVDTQPELNGSLSASYIGLDEYNGCDNFIIIRYQSPTEFMGLRINPGTLDQKGIYVSHSNPSEWEGESTALTQGDTKLNLINSAGISVSAETWPNKTTFPDDGLITVDITNNNQYSVEWWDSGHIIFYASAAFVDNHILTSAGHHGFFHTTKYDANIGGWDYIMWVDSVSAITPPTIESFSATNYLLTEGESTTLGWFVFSADNDTTVVLDDGVTGEVDLFGTSAIIPSLGDYTYTLSAYNGGGSVSASISVSVLSASPFITSFSADTPISAGGNSTLAWETSGTSVSAFIDNGIGWIDPINVSAGTYEVSALTSTTSYSLSAFDMNGYYVTDTTSVTVVDLPIVIGNTFSGTPNPICSGSDFLIGWTTSGATSAFIDNGVGWIDSSAVSSGAYGISASLPTTYSLSAWNDLGNITSASYIQQVYYRDPIANAGSDLVFSATEISGVSATFNASASYDPDGQSIASYLWTSAGDVISTSQYFTVVLSAGDHVFDLLVTDDCNQSGTDSVSASVTYTVPPIAIASATPYIVNAGDEFVLSGQESYDPDGSIVNYLWELSGTFVSATDVAFQSQNTIGDYIYTLTVTDTSGLSDSDTTLVHVNGIHSPSANAGIDQSYCMASGDTMNVLLAGTNSLPPEAGGTLAWYQWDLSAFGVANVSADIVTDASEIFTIVNNVSGIGTYDVGLTVSASNGIIDSDSVTVTIHRQAIASAGDDQGYMMSCDASFYDVSFSGSSDISGTYVWYLNNGTIRDYGQVISASYGVGTFSAGLEVVTTADDGTICTSEWDTVNVTISANSLDIGTFEFTPNFINETSAHVWTALSWEISGAVSASIDNGVGWLDTSVISAGNLSVSATDDVTYVLSAIDTNGCLITATATAIINLGTISACVLKKNYISLFGPEHIRWGDCRDINLIDMIPQTLIGTDTETYIQVYQDYLNEMYAGSCGYTLGASALDTCACEVSACLLSAVNNFYEHQTYLSGGISANTLHTPTDDVEKVFLSDFCQIPRKKISVLEKAYRLTELFDPDLIPIELIQFYAQNLGYEVGLSRDNVGLDFDGTQTVSQESINQKKYLRFMIRNLPTWYKIKTTRNSVKMMLYSFGLVGDFIYYFTRNYRDPKTGIGLNSLDSGTIETSGLNNFAVTDDMTYKELQELKCNLSQWEEFKKNKKAYFNMLNDLQPTGNDDWLLTNVNPVSVKEDISNIPDEFFSSPHFRVWFDILESLATGNFTTDLHKQKLISEAIKAIKPINTVFEGITGVFKTLVDVYYVPVPRFRKHISLFSDGYADWYM